MIGWSSACETSKPYLTWHPKVLWIPSNSLTQVQHSTFLITLPILVESVSRNIAQKSSQTLTITGNTQSAYPSASIPVAISFFGPSFVELWVPVVSLALWGFNKCTIKTLSFIKCHSSDTTRSSGIMLGLPGKIIKKKAQHGDPMISLDREAIWWYNNLSNRTLY